jgi:hypothetical protein
MPPAKADFAVFGLFEFKPWAIPGAFDGADF